MRPGLGDSAPWLSESSNMRGHGCLGASGAHRVLPLLFVFVFLPRRGIIES